MSFKKMSDLFLESQVFMECLVLYKIEKSTVIQSFVLRSLYVQKSII